MQGRGVATRGARLACKAVGVATRGARLACKAVGAATRGARLACKAVGVATRGARLACKAVGAATRGARLACKAEGSPPVERCLPAAAYARQDKGAGVGRPLTREGARPRAPQRRAKLTDVFRSLD